MVSKGDDSRKVSVLLPSLMLSTPGCCARDEMGALSSGVFWGVLVKDSLLALGMLERMAMGDDSV